MQYLSLLLSVFACCFSWKLLKEQKKRPEAVSKNQSVISRISPDRELIFCQVMYFGDEVPHVLIDRRDRSVIRPEVDFDNNIDEGVK